MFGQGLMLHAIVQEARMATERMEMAKRRETLWTFPEISGRWRVSDEDMCQLLDGAATLRVQDWSGGAPWVKGPNGLVGGTAWANKSAVEQGKPPPTMKGNPEGDVWQTQEGGTHYKDMAIQPMQYSMANKLDPMQHTIIKYVSRFRAKNGVEDLRKARQTLDLLINWEEQNAAKL